LRKSIIEPERRKVLNSWDPVLIVSVQEEFHQGGEEEKILGLDFLTGMYCLAALSAIFDKVENESDKRRLEGMDEIEH
jgi:hypothetical protein